MGISRSELVTLKSKIKAEMLRRNGLGSSSKLWTPSKAFGSLSSYGGSGYDFTHSPIKGGKIYKEYGEKTIDLLLKVKDYDGLTATKEGEAITTGFNSGLITKVNNLAKEKFTGETAATVAARKAAGEKSIPSVETSSCKGACTGLCVGSCIGMCNGCYSTCTASCGSGCESGSKVTTYAPSLCKACTSACTGGCQTSCGSGCTSCGSGCTACTGCGAACRSSASV